MPLNKEQFETLPDFVKADYVEHEGAYVPAAELKVSKLKSSLDGLDSKLKEFEKNEHAKLEAARAEALEKLKKEGKVDEILADAERRLGETKAQYEERLAKITNTVKAEKRNAIVSDLAAELATLAGSKAFKALIGNRIDVDPETGKVTFLNADGSASALDLAGFKADIEKDESFSPLLKAPINVNGGGFANGSNGGSAPTGAGSLAGNRSDREKALASKFKNLPLS